MSERIENIAKAVEAAAECPASHVESVVVVETFRGQTVWEGMVEVFTLQGHAKAKRAYGWRIGTGRDARYTAVLELPPVDSPNTAVRAAIAAQARK
jgi:hypothetical protein